MQLEKEIEEKGYSKLAAGISQKNKTNASV